MSLLSQFLTGGNLAGLQKGFDEFAFAALNCFFRSTLTCPADILSRSRERGILPKLSKPWAFRHFGFGAEPIRHQPKLIGGNVAAADAVKQMIEEVWRKIVAPNLRHGYSP